MTNTVTQLKPAARKTTTRKPAARTRSRAKPTNHLQVGLSYVLAGVMPGLSTVGSHLASSLAVGHAHLAVFIGAIVATVFCVSLHHGVKALRMVLHLPAKSACALALALDATVIAAEMTDTLAPEIGAHWLCVGTMAAIGLISATLNMVTFRSYK